MEPYFYFKKKKVDPKFLRNLKFSKKHNVRNPKPAGAPKIPKVAKPAPVKAVPPPKAVAAPAKAAPTKAAPASAKAAPQKK